MSVISSPLSPAPPARTPTTRNQCLFGRKGELRDAFIATLSAAFKYAAAIFGSRRSSATMEGASEPQALLIVLRQLAEAEHDANK